MFYGPFARGVVSKRAGGDMNAEMDSSGRTTAPGWENTVYYSGADLTRSGALGYVNVRREVAEQAAGMVLQIDALVHATGSSGTQAGAGCGLAAIQSDIHLLGIGVGHRKKSKSNWF